MSVVFDSCAGTPSQEAFLSTMKMNLVVLKTAFAESEVGKGTVFEIRLPAK